MRTPTKGHFRGNAIITGSSCRLFCDYERAKMVFDKFDIIAVNFSGICFKNVVHLVSLHADRIPAFVKAASIDNGRHVHTHTIIGNLHIPEVENAWDDEITNTGGSSALFACRVGIRLGYDRILLCGVPLTSHRRFYDPYETKSEVGDRATILAWQMAKEEFGDKIKSMSGRTRELLGEKWD